MTNLWNREPVAIVSFVKAVLYLVVLFGFDLTTEQIAGIILVVETGLALLQRSRVTPTKGV